MRFIFKPKHLEIKFSFKEILFILLRGCFRLERKSVYLLSTALMKIIHDMTEHYGDSKEHGVVDSNTGEIIENKKPKDS